MAASKTSIANGALLELGQETIGSIEDQDPNAVKIKAIYDLVLYELQSQDWFFTRDRVELSRLDDAPAFGSYDYQYNLPDDLVNIVATVDEYSDEIKYRYKREGRKILSNREEIFLIYNQLITQVGYMPPWFVRLFEMSLAGRLAPKIVKDEIIIKRIETHLVDAWDDARSGNAQDSYFEDEHGDTDGNKDWAYGEREPYI